MEGKWFLKMPTVCPLEAIAVLLSIYFSLHIEYPGSLKCLFQFLDFKLLNIKPKKGLASSIIDIVQKARL